MARSIVLPAIFGRRLPGPAAEGAGQRTGLAEADQEGDIGQLQRRVAQIVQHQLLAGFIDQLAERQPRFAQAPLQSARAQRQLRGQLFQLNTCLLYTSDAADE